MINHNPIIINIIKSLETSIMSRTFRNPVYEYNYFRHPKTQGERKKLDGFIRDSVFEEFSISGINHAHHRLNRIPTSYDDVGFSARQEVHETA